MSIYTTNSDRQNLPDGKYLDRLRLGGGELIDFGWRSNIIVDRCRILLSSFVKGDAPLGIQHIALGRGDPNWDDVPYEAPVATTFELVDPIPETILITDLEMSVEFIDVVGAITATPSNRLLVTSTIEGVNLPIGPGEAFPLREFALFGGLGVEDYMIDYVRHPVINISSADTLVRQIRLVF